MYVYLRVLLLRHVAQYWKRSMQLRLSLRTPSGFSEQSVSRFAFPNAVVQSYGAVQIKRAAGSNAFPRVTSASLRTWLKFKTVRASSVRRLARAAT